MHEFSLQEPLWLLLLLGLPLCWRLRWRRGTNAMIVPFSSVWWQPSLNPITKWPIIFSVTGVIVMIVALARPQILEGKNEVMKEGYDIMLAIDLSGSMQAEDYERNGQQMNRLEALKPVVKAFIADRPNDRIGLIVFAGRAYTLAPLTFDHDWLARQTQKLKIGLMEDGTAIGDGLGMALARLQHSKAGAGQDQSSAFVVLLTDGSNNAGALKPMQAADIAESRKIPVYTIGAGKAGTAPFPIFDGTGKKVGYRRIVSDLDETTLQQIADRTKGKFFRADSTDTVEAAFKAIDSNQKLSFQARTHLRGRDLFDLFLWVGAALVVIGALSVRLPWQREVVV